MSTSMYEVAKKVDNAHKDGVWCVAWNKETIFTGSGDGILKTWGAETMKETQVIDAGHHMGVSAIAIDKSGFLGASTGLDMNIRLWDMQLGKAVRTIEAGPLECWSLSLSPDGKIVASGSQSGNINVWNTDTGAKEQTLTTSGKFIMSVAISPDQQLVACGASDGVVQVFDIESMRRLHTLPGHSMAVRSLSFASDSTTLVTGSDDMHINQYDLRAAASSSSGTSANQITSFSGHASWVLSAAVSPSNNLIASGSSDRKVKIWDLGTRRCVHTFSDHSDQVWGVAWNTSGSKLVSTSDDRSLVMYISQ